MQPCCVYSGSSAWLKQLHQSAHSHPLQLAGSQKLVGGAAADVVAVAVAVAIRKTIFIMLITVCVVFGVVEALYCLEEKRMMTEMQKVYR